VDLPDLDELHLMHSTVCKAVTEPRRIRILYALGEQPRNVTELAERLGTPQPTVSRHLAILRQAGMVEAQREGASVIYTLAEPRVLEVLNLMRAILRETLERQTNILE
jgi:DNA-binding transcriptional ArsR family regulator